MSFIHYKAAVPMKQNYQRVHHRELGGFFLRYYPSILLMRQDKAWHHRNLTPFMFCRRLDLIFLS